MKIQVCSKCGIRQEELLEVSEQMDAEILSIMQLYIPEIKHEEKCGFNWVMINEN